MGKGKGKKTRTKKKAIPLNPETKVKPKYPVTKKAKVTLQQDWMALQMAQQAFAKTVQTLKDGLGVPEDWGFNTGTGEFEKPKKKADDETN